MPPSSLNAIVQIVPRVVRATFLMESQSVRMHVFLRTQRKRAPSQLRWTSSCGHGWNRHLLLFSIHLHCPSVRVGTWLLVLRGADSSSHGHLPESTKAHLQGRHLFLLFCWRGTGFWGPRRLPCGLGGTGLPLLQGSHLGIPGGKLLLECEHLLLQCLLHCAAALRRFPLSVGYSSSWKLQKKKPSLPPAGVGGRQ